MHFKHLRSFSISCLTKQAQNLKPLLLSLIMPFLRPSDRKLFNNAYNAWENGSMTTQAYKLNSLC